MLSSTLFFPLRVPLRVPLLVPLLVCFHLFTTAHSSICVADEPSMCSGNKQHWDTKNVEASPAVTVDNWYSLQAAPGSADRTKFSMSKPMLEVSDLNNDGLMDIVVSSQISGQGCDDNNWGTNNDGKARTKYELLLMVNTGSAATPAFTTVEKSATSPYLDPFIEVRTQRASCNCDGGWCCDHWLRDDGFSFCGDAPGGLDPTGTPELWSDQWPRGMPISLADIIGNDGLVDLVIGYNVYKNIGTSSWPKYSESSRTVLRTHYATHTWSPGEDPNDGNGKINLWTKYNFHDFDNDGDLDAVVTSLGNRGQVYLFQNIGTADSPIFDHWTLLDTRTVPHFSATWGSVIVADFDNDGRTDVMVGGDMLYNNRGSITPKFTDLGLGQEVFNEKTSRSQFNDVRLTPVTNFSTSLPGLSFLRISPDETPKLQIVTSYMDVDRPIKLTRWSGKKALPTQGGIKFNDFSGFLGSGGDMNGDGRKDFMNQVRNIFVCFLMIPKVLN